MVLIMCGVISIDMVARSRMSLSRSAAMASVRNSPSASFSSARFFTVFFRCQVASSHSDRETPRYPGRRVQSGSTCCRASGYWKGCSAFFGVCRAADVLKEASTCGEYSRCRVGSRLRRRQPLARLRRVLRLKVGPFPVTVYPWFFLSAILLGVAMGLGFRWQMLAWILIVFVSVLVHELGHAIVGRLYGGHPEVRLEAFGGVTFPQVRTRLRPTQQFILSFAGPIAGLLLGGAASALEWLLPPEPGSITSTVVNVVQFVSVYWAIFNLLPILPLDGGQMLLAFLEGARKRPSLALTSWISVVASIATAGFVTWQFGRQELLLLWLALFAYQNFQRARAAAVQH